LDKAAIHARIVAFLSEATSHPETELLPETKLFDGGLQLDSFATVELISQIEEHYDFEFSDEDFLPENFVDLSTLCALVETYVMAGGGDAAG
jgi:acyl carrier protein